MCVFVCVCMYVYVRRTHTRIHTHSRFLCLSLTQIYTYTFIYAYTHSHCTYVCLSVCVCVCVCGKAWINDWKLLFSLSAFFKQPILLRRDLKNKYIHLHLQNLHVWKYLSKLLQSGQFNFSIIRGETQINTKRNSRLSVSVC